ncbi:uncharacterized protein CPUR_05420 [Claviceps purpurea 20.1]|uniref:SHSP domain-containing protein CPUR_05420 n=1 Tax=Claviceps purpurea (strain 20.1) TaxID=1111077 RepID=PIG19_CLAP2|nr:RecName: Full=SHSP domain-containing protein CPUR_05420; AltName: Full=Ergochrome biosynthesis cluster protein CPUR_05420 [Claviceps purpurea 20.1]CCE31567.1 uncharacterized protein CPUR_05420 [Claviceps purpurea 20.1]
MATMAHANTSHPLYVAGMAGNTNHMSPWGEDAHKRWLAALGPSSLRGPFAWQTCPQQRHPHQPDVSGPPGSGFGEQPSQDTPNPMFGATGPHQQHNFPSHPYAAHNSKEAHEAWLKVYQSVWGNTKHAGAWSGPWSPAAGGRQHHMSGGGGGGGPRWMGGPMPWTQCDETKKSFTPDIDVVETPESYSVQASLPGAKKEDVKVSWDPSTYELRIEGVVSRSVGNDEEGEKKTEQSGRFSLRERQTGKFCRTVYLGSQVDGDKIEEGGLSAGMDDGVLRIAVPRQGSGKGVKEITIV